MQRDSSREAAHADDAAGHAHAPPDRSRRRRTRCRRARRTRPPARSRTPRRGAGAAPSHCACSSPSRSSPPGGSSPRPTSIPPTTLSTPAATWDAFIDLLRHQDLIGDIGVSARRAVLGLALGAGSGLSSGIVVGLTRLGEELLDAPLQMLRMVPYPAVIFLFIIWFGIGETAKVLLIGLATLFPMYLNTSNGVRNVDRRVVEAARSFGLRGRRLVRQVVVPLAMPSILTGLRFSAGISVDRPRLHREHRGQPGHRLPGQPGRQPAADPRPRGLRHHLRAPRHRAPTSSSACWSGSPCRGGATAPSDDRSPR